ncbi:hypothetical protein E2C01_005852 [Portunus trituberculatus]|uniref:Uncharacterized protein n=1 Tax=Portunus trituberculatus TaxID=210409 RepID=A0A5B7CTR7_PORTR|nr:hypothetical protein [Portunus trituberculatus]
MRSFSKTHQGHDIIGQISCKVTIDEACKTNLSDEHLSDEDNVATQSAAITGTYNIVESGTSPKLQDPTTTVIRTLNRARASCPSDLSFDLDLDYLEETIPEEFFRTVVNIHATNRLTT